MLARHSFSPSEGLILAFPMLSEGCNGLGLSLGRDMYRPATVPQPLGSGTSMAPWGKSHPLSRQMTSEGRGRKGTAHANLECNRTWWELLGL